MARKVITQTVFEDDLTGQEVSESELTIHRFTVDGVQYEIDLGPESEKKFAAAMGEWITAARKVGGRKKASSPARGPVEHPPSEIRDWARTNGIVVPDRGRIPEEIRQKFELAKAS